MILSDREFHESISTNNPALRVESDQDASVKVVPRDFTQTFERLAKIETAASSSLKIRKPKTLKSHENKPLERIMPLKEQRNDTLELSLQPAILGCGKGKRCFPI